MGKHNKCIFKTPYVKRQFSAVDSVNSSHAGDSDSIPTGYTNEI